MQHKIVVSARKSKKAKPMLYDALIMEARGKHSLTINIPKMDQNIKLMYERKKDGVETYSADFLGLYVWVEYVIKNSFSVDYKPKPEVSVANKSVSGISKSKSGLPPKLR